MIPNTTAAGIHISVRPSRPLNPIGTPCLSASACFSAILLRRAARRSPAHTLKHLLLLHALLRRSSTIRRPSAIKKGSSPAFRRAVGCIPSRGSLRSNRSSPSHHKPSKRGWDQTQYHACGLLFPRWAAARDRHYGASRSSLPPLHDSDFELPLPARVDRLGFPSECRLSPLTQARARLSITSIRHLTLTLSCFTSASPAIFPYSGLFCLSRLAPTSDPGATRRIAPRATRASLQPYCAGPTLNLRVETAARQQEYL